jgi:hypothetical protein
MCKAALSQAKMNCLIVWKALERIGVLEPTSSSTFDSRRALGLRGDEVCVYFLENACIVDSDQTNSRTLRRT